MSEVQQPETTAPDILAWREFTIRFTDPNDPVRGETSIREAFAAGWNAALASDTEAVREPDALDVDVLARAIRALGDRYPITGSYPTRDSFGSETWWEHGRLADAIAAEYRRLRESGQ